ncbi:MAG: hypothetical protein KF752_04850 [Pirellulaceae bacterium]|nr:hypothetical protein [Pirellulaceae bacterium]
MNRYRLFYLAIACLPALSGCSPSTIDQLQSNSSASGSRVSTDPGADQDNSVVDILTGLGVQLTVDEKSGQVTSADCRNIVVSDLTAGQLAALRSLQRLTIRDSRLTLTGWQQLSKLRNLQQLDLRDCRIDNQQLSVVAGGMSALRVVRVGGSNHPLAIDDSSLSELLPGWPRLKVLAADHVPITGQCLPVLKSCPELSELYLGHTRITDSALSALAGCSRLRKLRLAGTEISSRGLESLANLALEELDVSQCPGLDDLALIPIGTMTTLHRLNLYSVPVSDQGLPHLAGLTNLNWLNLDNTRITDAGLPALRGLKELSFLHLGLTAVTDSGMSHLIGLGALRELVVTRTAVTGAGADLLRQTNPALSIELEYQGGR